MVEAKAFLFGASHSLTCSHSQHSQLQLILSRQPLMAKRERERERERGRRNTKENLVDESVDINIHTYSRPNLLIEGAWLDNNNNYKKLIIINIINNIIIKLYTQSIKWIK